mgnify:CR=1 FL=1
MTKDLFNLNVEEMTQAGLGTGHRVSRLHPRMKPYVSGIKSGVHTFDLEKTAEKFSEALNFIKNLISDGKILLIVGTKIPSRDLVRIAGDETNLPIVNNRWLGGIFTNFETISKRVNYYKQLLKDKQSGALEKYTKKERLLLDKKIESLKTKFDGIKEMSKLPEAVLVLDMKKDLIAAKEARKKGVKIIAVCDTNIDPNQADYMIPANDDAISSIKYILEKVKNTAIEAKKDFESKQVQKSQ